MILCIKFTFTIYSNNYERLMFRNEYHAIDRDHFHSIKPVLHTHTHMAAIVFSKRDR